MATVSRRDMLSASGVLVGATVLGLRTTATAVEDDSTQRKLKIIVVGAHPDDPETGCGGTIARYVDAGHDVASLYLTRGEAGIAGKSHEEAGRIRTAELEKACKILGARPLFAGQIDGASEVTNRRFEEFRQILEAEKPDAVFAHWPVDTHRDHRAAGMLAYDAWLWMGKKFILYYYEVFTGIETQQFQPTDYVDITVTESRKRAATMAHASMDPENHLYPLHDLMNRFRGTEFGCKYAEAFIRHVQGPEQQELLGV